MFLGCYQSVWSHFSLNNCPARKWLLVRLFLSQFLYFRVHGNATQRAMKLIDRITCKHVQFKTGIYVHSRMPRRHQVCRLVKEARANEMGTYMSLASFMSLIYASLSSLSVFMIVRTRNEGELIQQSHLGIWAPQKRDPRIDGTLDLDKHEHC
jgi:hypothetical protein